MRRRPVRPSRLCPALFAGCALLFAAPPIRAEVVMAQGESAPAAPTHDGVKVGGRLSSTASVEHLENAAAGKGARAVVETNRIGNTTVGGDLSATTEVGRLTQRAEGRDASAVTVIGRIRDVTTGGDLTNTVTLGTSLNIAIGAGARACTELGTLGGGPVCR